MGRTTIVTPPWPSRADVRTLTDRLDALEAREAPAQRDFLPSGTLELLTLTALVVYGAVRFADAAFYSRLGVSPDDVGLDYARTLGKVAGAVVLFGATIVMLFWAGWAADDERRAKAGTWLLVGFIPVGMFLLKTLLPPTSIVLIVVVTALVVAAGAIARSMRDDGRLAARRPRLSRGQIVGLLALGIVLVFGYAGIAGYLAAGYVVDGKPLPCGCSKLFGHNVALPWVSGSQGFLGVQADEAEVRWATNSDRPQRVLPRRPIYLGTADELVALYDPDAKAVVRLPVSEIVLKVEPHSVGWDES